MAGGTSTDFKIYNDQFFLGANEIMMQNSNVFNGASQGTIILMDEIIRGEWEAESFMKSIGASIITRRDTTSIAAVVDQKLEQGEEIGIKLSRKIGPVSNTMSSWRLISTDPEEMSFILGQQTAVAMILEQVNTALGCLNSAIGGTAAITHDITGATDKTVSHDALIGGMRKMGDAVHSMKVWVMHSQSWNDMLSQAIGDKIFEEAGVVVYGGTPGTFNKPVMFTDSDSLIDTTPTPDEYSILGLTESAVTVKNSEERYVTSDEITGQENLSMRIQGEYAYNVKIKGFTYDVTNGGVNPSQAALFTGTNWDQTMADVKSGPGVLIKTILK